VFAFEKSISMGDGHLETNSPFNQAGRHGLNLQVCSWMKRSKETRASPVGFARGTLRSLMYLHTLFMLGFDRAHPNLQFFIQGVDIPYPILLKCHHNECKRAVSHPVGD
jgi:hypothetical protein